MNNKKFICSAISIASFFILIILSSYFLLKTSLGSSVVFEGIRYLATTNSIDGEKIERISFDKVSGSILGTLTISDLKLHFKDIDIAVKKLNAKTIFKILPLSLVNQNLHLDNVIVTPHFSNHKKNSKKSNFLLPLTINADNIYINDIQINYKRNKQIHFSKIAGTFKASSKKISADAYQIDKPNSNLSVYHDQNNDVIDLHFPFRKTICNLNYTGVNGQFNLYGEIKDYHNGNIILKGVGQGKTAIELNMKAKNIHLNDLLIDYWPGALDFNLQFNHQLNITHIKLDKLNGLIGTQSLQGQGKIEIENNIFSNLYLNMQLHDSKISVIQNNKISSQVDWLIKIPKLEEFLPNNHAEILAKGTVENFSILPVIKGEFSAKNLDTKNLQIEKIAGEFMTNLTASMPDSFLQLRANRLKSHKLSIDQIFLNLTGCLKKHQIKIDANNKDQKLAISIEGKYENPQWLGKVDQLTFLNNRQQWNLQKSFDISIDKKGIIFGLINLSANQSKVSLQGTYPFGHLPSGEVSVHHFDLSLVNFLFPNDIKIDGKMNLIAIADPTKTNKLSITGYFQPGTFYYRLNNEIQKNSYNEAKFSALLSKHDLSSFFEVNFPQGKLTSQIKLPHYSFNNELKNQQLDGKINFQFSEIKILQFFIPAIKNMHGNLMGHYDLAGTFLKPILHGELILNRGSFQIPKLNLNITNVNIAAKSDKSNILYHGSLTSGKGTLSINGFTKLDTKGFPIDLELHGNNILICDQPDIKVFASPDMHLLLANNTLKLTGKLFLPEANIHPHDFGSSESASEDIIIVNQNAKQPQQSNLKLISSIQLSLGNKIYLNTHGIKGNILGQIQIEDDPSKATVAYGQLWLQDGSYNIYGKTLQIDDGKLLFSGGPISNPGLNIKASRTIQAKSNTLFNADETIKVGVSVSGTIKEPKINLFSEPPGKNSADILSYLVLGIPLNSLNDATNKSSTQLLLQAANALNLGGNSKIFNLKNQLKKGLGLSELDIGTSSEIDPTTQETIQHTAFVLGKYLSPKFYVNYSLDLFDHTNTLKVRYFINRFWTIQSVANTNSSGVDILYTVEK